MSNGILYDPLLVRYLAEELDRRLRGRASAAAPLFASDRSAVLPLDRGEALRLDLHPARGWIRIVPWTGTEGEPEAFVDAVEAPGDERLLVVRLRGGDRFRSADRRMIVELHSNQWNAVLVAAEDDRILSVLRAREAGERVLWPGHAYVPPPGRARFGAGAVERGEARARWEAEVASALPATRRAALLDGFAFVGTPNADWILGADGGGADAFERWWRLRALPQARPVLLRTGRRLLPYPLALDGLPAEPVDSLLAGMDRLAAAGDADEARGEDERLPRIAARVRAAERRVARLKAEAAGGEEADRMRGWGDLLLARLHAVPRGAAEAVLPDWEGNEARVPLDPALSPQENAARWYAEARKRERAAERLPALLAEAEQDVERWREAERAAAGGTVPGWAARALEAAEGGSRDADAGAGADTGSRPFRTYRTSGGLEVRVGRSAKDNDRLTFGHSRPHDVWLHARSVPGSHVILRWADPEGAPPARDLEEAATLAALYSRARTSALVPVDWTRRRHVRKPRGAAPGAVIPQRVRTLFVAPDAAVEERLRTW